MALQEVLPAEAISSLSPMEEKKAFCLFPMEGRLFWSFFWQPGDWRAFVEASQLHYSMCQR